MRVLIPVASLSLYLLGTALHEATHVIACLVTGAKVDKITAHPTAVHYDPPSKRVDMAVKAAPVFAALPLTTGYLAYLARDPFSIRLLGLAFLIGYIPRSQTDWEPFATMFK